MFTVWFGLMYACQETTGVLQAAPEPQISQSNTVRRKGFLGVTLEMSTPEMAMEKGYDRPLIVIRMVGPESAAAAAGIQADDVIAGADEHTFETIQDFVSYIQGKGAGETVVLKRVSGSSVEDVTVMLAARPGEAGLVRSMFIKREAPSFSYRTYRDDRSASLSDHKGKVVLIDFWATWCGPCLMSIPKLNQLHDKYAEKGLVILGVTDEPKDTIRSIARRYNIAYPLGIDREREAFASYFVSSLPTAFLIDREGRVQEIFVGAGHSRRLESKIEALLNP
ncbi:MAG: redoxin domain-containing protein [Myxococcota bacterium]|nr:redoxin domain-containing protein [Myxococcota bacterium]